MSELNKKELLEQNFNKNHNQHLDSKGQSDKLENEHIEECITIVVDGKVTVCCCDENGGNCSCTGIV